MTEQHVEAGQAVFARIGAACDRLTVLGFASIHEAVVLGVRERRG